MVAGGQHGTEGPAAMRPNGRCTQKTPLVLCANGGLLLLSRFEYNVSSGIPRGRENEIYDNRRSVATMDRCVPVGH